MVNEHYFNDCCKSKHLFNPDQLKYKIRGMEVKEHVEKASSSAPEDEEYNSLVIKKGGLRKRDRVPESQTTDEAAQETSQVSSRYHFPPPDD